MIEKMIMKERRRYAHSCGATFFDQRAKWSAHLTQHELTKQKRWYTLSLMLSRILDSNTTAGPIHLADSSHFYAFILRSGALHYCCATIIMIHF